MWTKRQTDMKKLTAAFHKFSNEPKDYILRKFLLGRSLQLSFTSFLAILSKFRTNILSKFSFRLFRMDFSMEKVTLQQDSS